MELFGAQQFDIVKSLCQGKQECVVQACHEFFKTKKLSCSKHDKGYLWLHWKCNGRDAIRSEEVTDIVNCKGDVINNL